MLFNLWVCRKRDLAFVSQLEQLKNRQIHIFFLNNSKNKMLWAETFYAKSQCREEFYGQVINLKNMAL